MTWTVTTSAITNGVIAWKSLRCCHGDVTNRTPKPICVSHTIAIVASRNGLTSCNALAVFRLAICQRPPKPGIGRGVKPSSRQKTMRQYIHAPWQTVLRFRLPEHRQDTLTWQNVICLQLVFASSHCSHLKPDNKCDWYQIRGKEPVTMFNKQVPRPKNQLYQDTKTCCNHR